MLAKPVNYALYEQRTEMRFQVGLTPWALPGLWRELGRFLPLREFVPGRPVTDNSTIYFDNDDLTLLKVSLTNPSDHLRVRARRYEYGGPPPRDGGEYWLELKVKHGEIRRKRRLRLSPDLLRALLQGATQDEDILDATRGYLTKEACHALYRELKGRVVGLGLKPIQLTSYRRVAFEEGRCRVTFDWDLRHRLVNAGVLGCVSLKDLPTPPAGQDEIVVMELKVVGEPPVWFENLRRRLPIAPSRSSLSKCERGMRALLLSGPLRSRPDAMSLVRLIDSRAREGEVRNAAS